jgi:hypothetical protein
MEGLDLDKYMEKNLFNSSSVVIIFMLDASEVLLKKYMQLTGSNERLKKQNMLELEQWFN